VTVTYMKATQSMELKATCNMDPETRSMLKRLCPTCAFYNGAGCCRLVYDPLTGKDCNCDMARAPATVLPFPVRTGFPWCGVQGENWKTTMAITTEAAKRCRYDFHLAIDSLENVAASSLREDQLELLEHLDECLVQAAISLGHT
jgi:hypothetical protein